MALAGGVFIATYERTGEGQHRNPIPMRDDCLMWTVEGSLLQRIGQERRKHELKESHH